MWVDNLTRGWICKGVKVQRKILDECGKMLKKVQGVSVRENIG